MPARLKPHAIEVTIIPDDTGYSPDRPDADERIARIGERTEDGTRRIAAAIAGALEGFVEALERYDVGNEGKRALHDAGEIARAAGAEGRAQADTPEMRQLGEQIRTAGSATSGVVGDAAGNVRETFQHGAQSVRDAAHHARDSAQHMKEEVKVRAEAVAESGRRARVAPRHIMEELGEAWAAWKRAIVTSIAMAAVMFVVGITAFIVLTIGLVQGLALLVGYVGALFLVTLIYTIVAGIAYAVAKGARTHAAREREERMENIREEARHVVRPVRDAFSRGRGIEHR